MIVLPLLTLWLLTNVNAGNSKFMNRRRYRFHYDFKIADYIVYFSSIKRHGIAGMKMKYEKQDSMLKTKLASLGEVSMRYEKEMGNSRKLVEKLNKEISQLKKGMKIEQRRVKYYQHKHLKIKKALMNRFDREDENATTIHKTTIEN